MVGIHSVYLQPKKRTTKQNKNDKLRSELHEHPKHALELKQTTICLHFDFDDRQSQHSKRIWPMRRRITLLRSEIINLIPTGSHKWRTFIKINVLRDFPASGICLTYLHSSKMVVPHLLFIRWITIVRRLIITHFSSCPPFSRWADQWKSDLLTNVLGEVRSGWLEWVIAL